MSRQQSAIIKGIAILLMLVYHLQKAFGRDFLSFEVAAFLDSISFPIIYFEIISGYGLYLAAENGKLTWSYLLKRSARLYIALWVVMIVFIFGIASWMYPGKFKTSSPYRLFTNFIGWRWDYCQFTWFLLPYILMTFCSKWIFWVLKRIGSILSIIFFFFVMLGMTWLISRYYDPFLRHHQAIYLVVLTMQTFLGFSIGAAMARRVQSGKSLTWSKLQGKNPLVFALLLLVFFIKGYFYGWKIFYIPFFYPLVIWVVLHFKLTWVSKYIFIPLGNKTMMMWFAHGYIAFRMFSEYFLLLQCKPLIYLTWVIVTYCVACLLTPVADRLSKALKLTK